MKTAEVEKMRSEYLNLLHFQCPFFSFTWFWISCWSPEATAAGLLQTCGVSLPCCLALLCSHSCRTLSSLKSYC